MSTCLSFGVMNQDLPDPPTETGVDLPLFQYCCLLTRLRWVDRCIRDISETNGEKHCRLEEPFGKMVIEQGPNK